MLTDLKSITFEQREHIAIVTLNRPQARNAYDDTMQGVLHGVKFAVITTSGAR